MIHVKLTLVDSKPTLFAVSPFREMGAYETMWCEPKAILRFSCDDSTRNAETCCPQGLRFTGGSP